MSDRMFKVIVAGGRDLKVGEKHLNIVRRLVRNKHNVQFVTGCATGADQIPYLLEGEYGEPKQFPADWDNTDCKGAVVRYARNGKPYNAIAGHMRNEAMAQYADALIAFWDGKSKGTLDMINRAKKHRLQVRIIKY